jgi:hypothetical protein
MQINKRKEWRGGRKVGGWEGGRERERERKIPYDVTSCPAFYTSTHITGQYLAADLFFFSLVLLHLCA